MDTKKLRQKILDLAIRGKLVPQDPNDEPASVLLERIRAEKERLVKEGKIKKSKASKTSDTPHYEQVPFEVPSSWVWCKLEDIAYVASGSTPSKDSFVAHGVPYIKMYNLRNQKIDFDYQPQYIKEEVHNGKLQRSRTEIGDLIMNIVGPPLGKLAIIPNSLPQANFNQAAVLIRPLQYKEVLVKYLFYYLSEMTEINSISTKGSAGQVNISLTQSQNMRIPSPPLAEQKRIVAEIERWFVLVDQIEQGKVDLQTTIKQAKSKILDLAIHGKLVPQDPSDEPASELLKRINSKAEITCDNGQYGKVPFEIPDNWLWLNHNELLEISGGSQPAKSYFKDAPEDGYIRLYQIRDYGEHPIPVYIPKELASKKTQRGDILLARYGGSLGKVFIAEEGAYNVAMAKVIFKYEHLLYKEFVYFYYLSKLYQDKLQTISRTAQAGFNSSDFEDMFFPLPPIEEQQRIVYRIKELYSILDNIQKALEVYAHF